MRRAGPTSRASRAGGRAHESTSLGRPRTDASDAAEEDGVRSPAQAATNATSMRAQSLFMYLPGSCASKARYPASVHPGAAQFTPATTSRVANTSYLICICATSLGLACRGLPHSERRETARKQRASSPYSRNCRHANAGAHPKAFPSGARLLGRSVLRQVGRRCASKPVAQVCPCAGRAGRSDAAQRPGLPGQLRLGCRVRSGRCSHVACVLSHF